MRDSATIMHTKKNKRQKLVSSSSQQNTNSFINNTITTIGGTTTKANNELHVESINAIIYIALIKFMSELIFPI